MPKKEQRNIHLTVFGYPGKCEHCSKWVVNPINHSSAGCTIEYTELIVCFRCNFPTEIDGILTGFHDHNPNSRDFCTFDEEEKKKIGRLACAFGEEFERKLSA